MAHRSVTSRWRALSLLLIGLVAGTLLLTPAGAHIGTPNHLWKKHLKAKVVGQINKHLNKPMLISVPCEDWAAHSGGASIFVGGDVCQFMGPGADRIYRLSVPIPTALQGNAVKVTGMEFCYDSQFPGTVLDRVVARVISHTNGPGGPPTSVLEDDTDRTDAACRLYAMNTTLTPDDVLIFVIRADIPTEWLLYVGRTTIRIQRTGSVAPPLS